MSLAEDIADKVPSKKGKPDEGDVEANAEVMKPGDHGKLILAAIKSGDAEAVESAIRDCVGESY